MFYRQNFHFLLRASSTFTSASSSDIQFIFPVVVPRCQCSWCCNIKPWGFGSYVKPPRTRCCPCVAWRENLKKTSRTSSIVLLFLAQQNSLSMSWLLQRKQGVILQEIPFPCPNWCSHVLDMGTLGISLTEGTIHSTFQVRTPLESYSISMILPEQQNGCTWLSMRTRCYFLFMSLGNPIFN